MIECCFNDNTTESNLKCLSNIECKQCGIEIYDCFNKNILIKNNYNGNILLLYPIFNFFYYFQQQKNIEKKIKCFNLNEYANEYFYKYHKNDTDINNDINIINILKTDLNISKLRNCKRMYPFEIIAIRLCWIKQSVLGINFYYFYA